MTARVIPFALLLLLAGCGVAPPRIVAPPATAAPTMPAPAPPPAVADWRDAPLSPGGWRYAQDAAGSTARFGRKDAAADFEIRCDRATRMVALSRADASPGPMTVTTSYAARSWPAIARADGRVGIILPAADPVLDQLAFSRARVMIEGLSPTRLILPAWAEPARVIEDCRA